MADVTRAQVRDAIIFRADLPVAEPRRVSDAQLDTLINRSLLRLQGILESLHSEDYFLNTLPFGLAPGTDFNMREFPRIIHVMMKIASGTEEPQFLRLARMKEVDFELRGDEVTAAPMKWDKHHPPKWYVADNGALGERTLKFTPVSTVFETLLFVYQAELTYTDDVKPVVLEYAWEEWIVLDCLVAIRQRDKQDANDILGERERTEKKVRDQAAERFKDERVTVLDRDGYLYDGERYPWSRV